MKSMLKAISILKVFLQSSGEMTPAEIANKVGIPKPTVYRMLSALSRGGLLEQKQDVGKYSIGPLMHVLGNLYLGTTSLVSAAEPVVRLLNELSQDAVNISIFQDGYVTTIFRQETKRTFRWQSHIGRTVPAYASSMGKAILSELSDEEIDKLYPNEELRPLTKKTVTSKMKLKRELEQIRKTGVAFNREGGLEGIVAVGSAIHDASGKVVSAMNIVAPTFTMNRARCGLLAELIIMGASLVSYRLGYRHKGIEVHDTQEIYSWWNKKYDSSIHERSQ